MFTLFKCIIGNGVKCYFFCSLVRLSSEDSSVSSVSVELFSGCSYCSKRSRRKARSLETFNRRLWLERRASWKNSFSYISWKNKSHGWVSMFCTSEQNVENLRKLETLVSSSSSDIVPYNPRSWCCRKRSRRLPRTRICPSLLPRLPHPGSPGYRSPRGLLPLAPPPPMSVWTFSHWPNCGNTNRPTFYHSKAPT